MNVEMWYTSIPPKLLEIWLILIIFYVSSVHGAVFQRFANQPSPQTAVVGSTVVLPCRIINMAGVLQWTRDGFGLGNERQLYAFKRYEMIGSDEEGDFSLRISPVTLEDDAVFQCQATGNMEIPGIRSQEAKLTVYVPPEPPELSPGPVVKTTAGIGVQLTCLSRGGKPAPEIQWLDGDGRAVTKGVQYTNKLLEDGHRQDAKSTLSFLGSREHHNKVFTCAASNPAIHQPLSSQVTLEVRYPPEVTIIHNQDGYKEGETAKLTCSASANPQRLTFRWYHLGQLIEGNNSTQLVVKDVTRDDNLRDITCEVANEVGTSKKITRLSIHYGPSFIVPPRDEFAELGENVTLQCQVDSLPDPTIVWINQQSQTVVGKGPQLELQVSSKTKGMYMCLAKVEGFPEISATIGLFLKVPPEVRAEKTQMGVHGETVLVECFVPLASSRSVRVTWMHHGEEVDIEKIRYEVVKDSNSDGLRHTLIIHEAKIDDFGTYNCSVENAFGSDIIEIILNKKKTLSMLVIVCAVCGGIVFLLIIGGAMVWCAKRITSQQRDAKSFVSFPETQVSLKKNENTSSCKENISKGSTPKDTVVEGWEKERDQPPATPTYSTSSYLYPETFTGIPLKVNGHLSNHNRGFSYGNYTEHNNLQNTNASSPASGQVNSPGYSATPVGLGKLVSSSQHNLFSSYPEYSNTHITFSKPQEGTQQEFSPQYTNGHTTQPSSTFSSGTLPLSLHVSSDRPGSTNTPTTTTTTSTTTLPRLGIPADPSQYIVPPRTQVMQGALATHV